MVAAPNQWKARRDPCYSAPMSLFTEAERRELQALAEGVNVPQVRSAVRRGLEAQQSALGDAFGGDTTSLNLFKTRMLDHVRKAIRG